MSFLPCSARSVLLAGALAFALAACGGGGEDQVIEPSPTGTAAGGATPTLTEQPTATPTITPSPAPETAVPEPPVPDADADCSAGDLLPQDVEPQGLTEPAAETWTAIRDAALACDYERLAEIAPDEGFSFTFGGAEDPAPYWRDAENRGQRVLAELVGILELPGAEDEDGRYVWPRVHVEPEDDAAWEELLEVYPRVAVDEWRNSGSGYVGYRTAISPEGEWVYFVAGD